MTLPGSVISRVPAILKLVEWAQQMIRVLDGKPLLSTQNWENYHAAAVMACNYHVTLIDAALELMEKAGIARDTGLAALEPLIRTTTENILRSGPEAALTAPSDAGIQERYDSTWRR